MRRTSPALVVNASVILAASLVRAERDVIETDRRQVHPSCVGRSRAAITQHQGDPITGGSMLRSRLTLLALAIVSIVAIGGQSLVAAGPQVSKPFAGAKVNGGTVTMNGRTLTVSDDFKVPDTPDPHWQVVDTHGNTFLLQRLAIKGDKVNRSITLPAFVKDVAKVQIYCAWAEVVLGETTFANVQMTN